MEHQRGFFFFFSVWVDLQWLLCLCCSRRSFFRRWHIFKSGVEIVSDILHVWFWVKTQKCRVLESDGESDVCFLFDPRVCFYPARICSVTFLFAVISHPAGRFHCGISLATVQCDVERASRPDVGGPFEATPSWVVTAAKVC